MFRKASQLNHQQAAWGNLRRRKGMMMEKFEDLLGTTIARVDGAEIGSERVTFSLTDGRRFTLFHYPDCCETVDLNEIIGDIDDLIGVPLARAEEVEGENNEPLEGKKPEYAESYTWTFYKLATIKGEVVLRWLGESNGYYSESVCFEEVSP